jgi:hypothetical protein
MIKKIFLTLLILFVAAAAAIFLFGPKILNEAIRQAVETVGPEVTQTPVTLTDVNLSLFSGKGSLTGLFVGNPEGYKNENIFELGQIDVEVDLQSLMTEKIIIKQIIIREPLISYEKQLRSSNLSALMANIEAFTGPAEAATAGEKPATEASTAPQFVIEHLLIEGGSIYVGVLGIGQTIPLPRIEINDIGGGERLSSAEMINLILSKVVTSIGPAITGAGGLLKDGAQLLGGAAGDSVSAAGDAANTAGEAVNAAGEAVKKTTDSIKSLFGK